MKFSNPFDPIKEPMNNRIFHDFIQELFRRLTREEGMKILTDAIYKEIGGKIESLNPDLLQNFNDLYKETQLLLKEQQKTIDFIEKKSKKLFTSSSLAEDVFKLKDDIKSYEKKLDKLLKAMRHSLD